MSVQGTSRRTPQGPLAARAITNRVFSLSTAMIGAIATLVFVSFSMHTAAPNPSIGVPAVAIAVLFALAARYSVRESLGGTAHVLAISEVPIVLGLFSLTPAELTLAALLGTLGAKLLRWRAPWDHAIFTIAVTVWEAVVVSAAFHWLVSDARVFSSRTWLFALALVVAARFVRILLTMGVVRLTGAPVDRRLAVSTLVFATAACLSLTGLALVGLMVATQSRLAIGLVVLVCAIPAVTYRAYVVLRERHERLRALYDFTEGLTHSTALADVLDAVLDGSRAVMNTHRAEVLLLDGASAVHRSIGGGIGAVSSPGTGDLLWQQVVDHGKSVSWSVTVGDPQTLRYLESIGARDLVAAPLRHDDELLGVLLVRDRLEDVPPITRSDRDLFGAVADQSAIAVHAARLSLRVRTEESERLKVAAHDMLTGLPNRASFHLAIDALCRELVGVDETRAAVFSLDLNRFKEVNSALGHATGDALIIGVANRVSAVMPRDAIVARLGGDEIAVLVTGITTAVAAMQLAEALQSALRIEFAIEDLVVTTDAAIGIVLVPDHGRDHITLMRRADVAMYSAKEHREGAVAVFDPDQEEVSNRQIGLVRDLRTAIENGELTVDYQPKANLSDGWIVGAEALVRWNHPRLGMVPPEEFIALAEHAGLVPALTTSVLHESLRQCRVWLEQGLGLHVAVNLSARSLREVGLVSRVKSALDAHGVPASLLTLEITEGEYVQDGPVARKTLQQLHELGVCLSIDDFGTGYSSLSYLARLTADEVKIDKSFITTMVDDEVNTAIVRAVVELAARLGLRTVAEGAEDQRTWDRLAELGIDTAQGYYLSRPVSGEVLGAWLEERRRATGPNRRLTGSNLRVLPRR